VIERFLRSPTGLATLSRINRAETVRILRSRIEGDVLMLVIRDTSPNRQGLAVDPVYWRAVFVAKDRLVTATVLSFADNPMGPEAGMGVLSRFVDRLRAANAAS
jgi:hypothetical protein